MGIPCPAVISLTTARIRSDYPWAADDTQRGFEVCRNAECYQGELPANGNAWVGGNDDSIGPPISLDYFQGALLLSWAHRPDPADYTTTDTFQLSYTTDPAQPATLLFKTDVHYTKTTFGDGVSDACGNWGVAEVDLSTGSTSP